MHTNQDGALLRYSRFTFKDSPPKFFGDYTSIFSGITMGLLSILRTNHVRTPANRSRAAWSRLLALDSGDLVSMHHLSGALENMSIWYIYIYILLLYIYDNMFEISYAICISLIHSHTSSTAQGGGGSFKNRKPIGEIGCCESGMAERSHWWTERCLISLTLSLSFSGYLPTYPSIFYVSIFLLI